MAVRIFARLLLTRPTNTVNFSAFKSSIALDKLYPTSSLNIARITSVPQKEQGHFSGFIPMEKISISYSRSSGPGGMNVNKVNTKVEIIFELEKADWIPFEVRENMKLKYRNQLSKEGCIIVQSDRTRFQHLNVADGLEKLREMIREAEPVKEVQLSPESIERLRRRRERVARERLQIKRGRSALKDQRGASSSSDL